MVNMAVRTRGIEAHVEVKQTEIGRIPNDWDVKPLEELALVTSGKRLPKGTALVEEITPHPYIRVTDMRRGTVDQSDIHFVPDQAAIAIKRYRIFSDDIFISVAGTLGLVGVVPPELNGANLTENADRITQIRCSQRYLMHVLLSPIIQRLIEEVCTVGAQPKLALTRLRKFLIPVPPSHSEQECIAETLSDADGLIEGLETLLAKKRATKQGAIQELLRAKPKCEIRPFKEISYMKGRIGWQGLKQSEFTDNVDEPFLITGMNFKDGEIRWDEVYHIPMSRYEMAPEIQLKPEDLLMTKDGTIGKILYVDEIPYPGEASLNSHLLLFRPIRESYHPKYLYYQLGSRRFKNFIELSKSGTTFFGLSQAAVGEYQVLLPPLEEQKRIAEILGGMDREISILETKLSKARHIKQGMMQDLLTGRVRLV